MIIDHTNMSYKVKWNEAGANRYNGAYYYSKEIVSNIIPYVVTKRHWVTINIPGVGSGNSIIFIHNNLHPENYDWLSRYSNMVLVCGVPETCDKVAHLGTPIYLPLSIDVAEVEKYKAPKTKDTAFVGRRSKVTNELPNGIDILSEMPRNELLKAMAAYENIFAVGRCALEAKALGCNILPYDPRFPDPDFWKVLDNREAAHILQAKLDEIDGEIKRVFEEVKDG